MDYLLKYNKYKIKYLDLKNKTETFQNFKWTENKRYNSNYEKYPPCYNISKDSREIYSILEKYNLLKKYHQLLDLYSIILCQKYHIQNKKKIVIILCSLKD